MRPEGLLAEVVLAVAAPVWADAAADAAAIRGRLEGWAAAFTPATLAQSATSSPMT